MTCFPQFRTRRAFSLVETALALGVIAFALTGLVALLPSGLSQFRQAMDTTLGSQIFQHVVTDVEQMEFDALLAAGEGSPGEFFALPTRFFDDQGQEVTAAQPERIIFQVRVRVSRPGPEAVVAHQTFTSLPAAPSDRRFAPRDAVFLTVQIVHRPGRAELDPGHDLLWPAAGAPAGALLTYSAVLTRNGYTSTPPS